MTLRCDDLVFNLTPKYQVKDKAIKPEGRSVVLKGLRFILLKRTDIYTVEGNGCQEILVIKSVPVPHV